MVGRDHGVSPDTIEKDARFAHSHQNDVCAGKTADKIANDHGVERPTVERAGRFAHAVDTPDGRESP